MLKWNHELMWDRMLSRDFVLSLGSVVVAVLCSLVYIMLLLLLTLPCIDGAA